MAAHYEIAPSSADPEKMVFRTNDWVDSIEYAVFQACGAETVSAKGFRKAFRVRKQDAIIIERALQYLRTHDRSSHSQAWLEMPDDGGDIAGRIVKTWTVISRKNLIRFALAMSDHDGSQA